MSIGPLNTPKALIKPSSSELLAYALRFSVGLILAITVALVGDRFIQYSTVAYIFVMTSTLLTFMHISKKWSFLFTLFFAGFCWLAGLLLQMYALVAPGQ